MHTVVKIKRGVFGRLSDRIHLFFGIKQYCIESYKSIGKVSMKTYSGPYTSEHVALKCWFLTNGLLGWKSNVIAYNKDEHSE